VSKASHLGFTAGPHWTDLLMGSSPEFRTRQLSRALTTAFLLRHLNGQLTDRADYDALLTQPL
jgi:hypothetical protein